jgi:hypothetical protein
MGDSEAMLRNNRKLRETGQRPIRRGIIPQDDGWDGSVAIRRRFGRRNHSRNPERHEAI